MIVLEARNVSMHFAPSPCLWDRIRGSQPNKRPLVRAVDNVSFSIHSGEIFGLLGESGSGKTTLARLLLGLLKPTSGQVFFEGIDLSTLPNEDIRTLVRRKARLLFQHPDAALNPAFTVAMMLDQALRLHTALPPTQRRDKAVGLLNEVGLPTTYLGLYPHMLSSGEKRRVGISRALATDPTLLIADEPVSGLDVAMQVQILGVLARLCTARGMTLLLITHDVGVVRKMCHRTGILYAGRLVEIGPREALPPGHHPYSQALCDAHLTLHHPPATLQDAPVSNPAQTGCPYRTSCSRWYALDQPQRCHAEKPILSPIAPRHQVACHFAG